MSSIAAGETPCFWHLDRLPSSQSNPATCIRVSAVALLLSVHCCTAIRQYLRLYGFQKNECAQCPPSTAWPPLRGFQRTDVGSSGHTLHDGRAHRAASKVASFQCCRPRRMNEMGVGHAHDQAAPATATRARGAPSYVISRRAAPPARGAQPTTPFAGHLPSGCGREVPHPARDLLTEARDVNLVELNQGEEVALAEFGLHVAKLSA